uniref:BK channel n=1 Tax=Macrostomum lignano TaxID=282301 RepID=A0A1I8F7H2_9PLAT
GKAAGTKKMMFYYKGLGGRSTAPGHRGVSTHRHSSVGSWTCSRASEGRRHGGTVQCSSTPRTIHGLMPSTDYSNPGQGQKCCGGPLGHGRQHCSYRCTDSQPTGTEARPDPVVIFLLSSSNPQHLPRSSQNAAAWKVGRQRAETTRLWGYEDPRPAVFLRPAPGEAGHGTGYKGGWILYTRVTADLLEVQHLVLRAEIISAVAGWRVGQTQRMPCFADAARPDATGFWASGPDRRAEAARRQLLAAVLGERHEGIGFPIVERRELPASKVASRQGSPGWFVERSTRLSPAHCYIPSTAKLEIEMKERGAGRSERGGRSGKSAATAEGGGREWEGRVSVCCEQGGPDKERLSWDLEQHNSRADVMEPWQPIVHPDFHFVEQQRAVPARDAESPGTERAVTAVFSSDRRDAELNHADLARKRAGDTEKLPRHQLPAAALAVAVTVVATVTGASQRWSRQPQLLKGRPLAQRLGSCCGGGTRPAEWSRLRQRAQVVHLPGQQRHCAVRRRHVRDALNRLLGCLADRLAGPAKDPASTKTRTRPPGRRQASRARGAAARPGQGRRRRTRTGEAAAEARAKDWAGELISGQTTTGRILVVLVFVVSIASLVVYIIDTGRMSETEECVRWVDSLSPAGGPGVQRHPIFLIYFFIRFIAAQDKLWFWFEMFSLVDILTIPPSFVAIYLNRTWIGMRSTRALRILSLPDVLQYLNTSTSIRLFQLITFFASLVLTAAGFLQHVLPDPAFTSSSSPCRRWDTATSTAPPPRGRILSALVIMGGLAVFANSIPEIADILSSRNKYGGYFRKEAGKQHNCASVANFLGDFLHEDREDVDVQIVILDKHVPDLELQGLFKRHFTQVEFFQGSVMNSKDLYCPDPDAEDAANIMRVISIKNFCDRIKVIIQLMQQGDDAVCVAELKLGFLAQSCLAFGFSTLLAKPVHHAQLQGRQGHATEVAQQTTWGRRHGDVHRVPVTGVRRADLPDGPLSSAAAADRRRGQERPGHGELHRHQPKENIHIEQGTQGFFIAQSAEEVKKAFFYCKRCHSDVDENPGLIKKCALQGLQQAATEAAAAKHKSSSRSRKPPAVPSQLVPAAASPRCRSCARAAEAGKGNSTRPACSTGARMFNFDDGILDREQVSTTVYTNHIVVCLFADASSPLIGLRNFVMPLRASNFHFHELKHIIFVGNLDYMRRDSASSGRLAAQPIQPEGGEHHLAEICIVLSSKQNSNMDDPTLVDKEAILCSLNIKAMISGFDALSVRILTELAVDDNVQFLDQDDDDDPDIELYMTQPFACGTAFARARLAHEHRLLQRERADTHPDLITGGATRSWSRSWPRAPASGGGFWHAGVCLANGTGTGRVAQIPHRGRAAEGVRRRRYSELFLGALHKHGILCIGGSTGSSRRPRMAGRLSRSATSSPTRLTSSVLGAEQSSALPPNGAGSLRALGAARSSLASLLREFGAAPQLIWHCDILPMRVPPLIRKHWLRQHD